MQRISWGIAVIVCLLAGYSMVSTDSEIKITLLGTGSPFPTVRQFGPATLVDAGGRKLLFDCGRGVVIRLKEAGVSPSEIDGLFLTHLHSDHVVGIPDLWLTGWFLGRKEPLSVWGPAGTEELVRNLRTAFVFDVKTRTATEDLPAKGVEIDAHEIAEGIVYEQRGLRVTAFIVDHGAVKPAFGYRVDYAGHSVVLSGDTKFSENLVKFAREADCLIHVAWNVGAKNPTPPDQRSLASAEDAARVFEMVKPKLAVVYHYKEEAGLADAIRASYKGQFVIGKDLMTIVIGREVSWKNGAKPESTS